MGQGLSCSREGVEHDLFLAAQVGDLDAVEGLLAGDPSLARRAATIYDRLSALHITTANGQLQVLSMLLELERGGIDVVNRKKRTPLMVAAMHGRIDCVLRLLHAGANMLMFDCVHGRTCLHHAANHGHADCLLAILSAAAQTSSPVAASWGFARFVNVRDESGATALHLAARQGRADCVRMLLDKGAIVSAPNWRGSTALHLAARGGDLDCIRELLAWGADRLQRDAAGRIPYAVAIKHGRHGNAALLNPCSAEPMVWPSPLKFISDLNPEAKALLQAALIQANNDNNNTAEETTTNYSEDDDLELCGICLEQPCNIQVQDCAHQMCAACTLALCCHSKPNPVTLTVQPPACPFCRGAITALLVPPPPVPNSNKNKEAKDDMLPKVRRSSSWRFRHPSQGSSSFRGLSSAISKIGRGSGRFADKEVDKPLQQYHDIM